MTKFDYIKEADEFSELLKQENHPKLAEDIQNVMKYASTGTELLFELKGVLKRVTYPTCKQSTYLYAQTFIHKINQILGIAA